MLTELPYTDDLQLAARYRRRGRTSSGRRGLVRRAGPARPFHHPGHRRCHRARHRRGHHDGAAAQSVARPYLGSRRTSRAHRHAAGPDDAPPARQHDGFGDRAQRRALHRPGRRGYPALDQCRSPGTDPHPPRRHRHRAGDHQRRPARRGSGRSPARTYRARPAGGDARARTPTGSSRPVAPASTPAGTACSTACSATTVSDSTSSSTPSSARWSPIIPTTTSPSWPPGSRIFRERRDAERRHLGHAQENRAATAIVVPRYAAPWFAAPWFAARGVRIERVLSDNGSAYRSYAWRDAGWWVLGVHVGSTSVSHERARMNRRSERRLR